MAGKPASEITKKTPIIQIFRSDLDSLAMVAPVVATYCGTRSAPLSLALHDLGYSFDVDEVYKLDDDAPVARTSVAGDTLFDNLPYELNFTPISESKGKYFALIVSSDTPFDNAPTVWLSDGAGRISGHQQCSQGRRPQGEFGLQARVGYAPKFSAHRVPRHILYSPITQCNLNCVHCISRDTRKNFTRIKHSTKSQIKKWCESGLIDSITTDYSGDILWVEYRYGGEINFLNSLNVPFAVDTNGVYLTQDISRRLMKSRITSLNISLDTPDAETYKWVRKGAPPLEVVLENIRGVVAARIEAEACARVRLSLSFTIMKSTIGQWEDFIRLAAKLGIEVVWSRHLEVYTPDLDYQSMWYAQSLHDEVQSRVQRLSAELGVQVLMQGPFENIRRSSGKRWCDAPWNSAVILGNGDVQVCCMPKTKIGNLNDTTMEELWNSSRYQTFRSSVNSVNPPVSCQVCPMHRYPNNEESYMPHRQLSSCVPPESWKLLEA